MRQRVLFLDDNEARHNLFQRRMRDHDVSAAFTSKEAIELLASNSPYDTVYLSHDLGEIADDPPHQEITGKVVAEYIASVLPPDRRPKEIIIHSWNITGSRWMRDLLRDAGLTVALAPF